MATSVTRKNLGVVGVRRRRTTRKHKSTLKKNNAPDGTYKKNSRRSHKSSNNTNRNPLSINACVSQESDVSVNAQIRTSEVITTLPASSSSELTFTSETDAEFSSQNIPFTTISQESVTAHAHVCSSDNSSAATQAMRMVPVPDGSTIISQDVENSEVEDIYKCPLLNWELCAAYSKKATLKTNVPLVEAMTKVLKVPVVSRTFSMTK